MKKFYFSLLLLTHQACLKDVFQCIRKFKVWKSSTADKSIILEVYSPNRLRSCVNPERKITDHPLQNFFAPSLNKM